MHVLPRHCQRSKEVRLVLRTSTAAHSHSAFLLAHSPKRRHRSELTVDSEVWHGLNHHSELSRRHKQRVDSVEAHQGCYIITVLSIDKDLKFVCPTLFHRRVFTLVPTHPPLALGLRRAYLQPPLSNEKIIGRSPTTGSELLQNSPSFVPIAVFRELAMEFSSRRRIKKCWLITAD